MMISALLAQGVPIGSTIGVEYGTTKSFSNLVGLVLSGGLMIAGIIVIFLILGGGLKVIMSAGENDPKGAAAGKQALTSGIIGFLIVFSAYWIIRLLETIFLTPFLTAVPF